MNTYSVRCTSFKSVAFGPMRTTTVVNVQAPTPGIAADMATAQVPGEDVSVRHVQLIRSGS